EKNRTLDGVANAARVFAQPRRKPMMHVSYAAAAAMSLIFASMTAPGLSAAAAASGPEQFRSAPHQPSRSVAASDEFSSAQRPARSRVRIVIRRSIWTEPGAIYGYPPGNYILGPYGMLYGPYPIRRSRSVADVGY